MMDKVGARIATVIHDKLIVARAEIATLEAERDKLKARLARARDVVKLLNAELSAPVSATYAIRWNHVAAIMIDLTDALGGAEEQEEGDGYQNRRYRSGRALR